MYIFKIIVHAHNFCLSLIIEHISENSKVGANSLCKMSTTKISILTTYK